MIEGEPDLRNAVGHRTQVQGAEMAGRCVDVFLAQRVEGVAFVFLAGHHAERGTGLRLAHVGQVVVEGEDVLGARSHRPCLAIARQPHLRRRPVEFGILVGILAVLARQVVLGLQAASDQAAATFVLETNRLEQADQTAGFGHPEQVVATILGEFPAMLRPADLKALAAHEDGEADDTVGRQQRPDRLGFDWRRDGFLARRRRNRDRNNRRSGGSGGRNAGLDKLDVEPTVNDDDVLRLRPTRHRCDGITCENG